MTRLLGRRGEAGARAKEQRDDRQGNRGSSSHHKLIRSEPALRTLKEYKLFSESLQANGKSRQSLVTLTDISSNQVTFKIYFDRLHHSWHVTLVQGYYKLHTKLRNAESDRENNIHLLQNVAG
jgi:hypothetical protein